MIGDHPGTVDMSPHLLTMYQGGEKAGDEMDNEMLGSVHGTLI